MTDPADERRSPLVALRELARFLAVLRTKAGMSQADVAQALRNRKIGRTKLHLIESGDKQITQGDLDTLLGLYKPGDDDRRRATELAEATRERGWWDDDPDMTAVQKRYAGLEWGARLLRENSGSIVAALLQTPDYTRALLSASDQPWSPEQLASVVATRRRRRAVLDGPDPLDYRVLMDEAALLRPAGPPAMMADQLLHIIEVASTHPNVEVRIVPFSAGLYPGTISPFTVFTFTDSDRLVHLEPGLASAGYVDDRADLDLYSRAFERMYGMALGRDETLGLLQSVATNRWSRRPTHDDENK